VTKGVRLFIESSSNSQEPESEVQLESVENAESDETISSCDDFNEPIDENLDAIEQNCEDFDEQIVLVEEPSITTSKYLSKQFAFIALSTSYSWPSGTVLK
jgi:hypothetical protein